MYVTTHTTTAALNPLTGKQTWKHEIQMPTDLFKYACCGIVNRGATTSDGKICSGSLDAYALALDVKAGMQLWRKYTTAAPSDKDGDTWPGDSHAKRGAPTWLTGDCDPELDLVYWGSGNAGPWNPEVRKGDNL